MPKIFYRFRVGIVYCVSGGESQGKLCLSYVYNSGFYSEFSASLLASSESVV